MSASIFTTQSKESTERQLQDALCAAKAVWDDLCAFVHEIAPVVGSEWKRYNERSGWVFRIKDKRRNLLYMAPRKGCFNVTVVLGKKAVAAAEDARLPKKVLTALREAQTFPEGRPVPTAVKSSRDLPAVKKLLRLKVEN